MCFYMLLNITYIKKNNFKGILFFKVSLHNHQLQNIIVIKLLNINK